MLSFRTNEYGSSFAARIQSDTAAGAGTTNIGNVQIEGTGTDLEGTIGGRPTRVLDDNNLKGDTGYDTEAKPEIWTDRAGFDAALNAFAEAVDAAIAANPQTLEELKAAAGPVFKSCKGCHENYRVEKED